MGKKIHGKFGLCQILG